MCGGPMRISTPPHIKLAALMEHELNATIDAVALRLFIQHHWSKVSMLAHAIHDEDKANRSAGAYDGS